MRADEILSSAAMLVSGERNDTHGDAETNLSNIARMWSAYRPDDVRFDAADVACMMALLKLARTKTGRHNADDYIDCAGYAGLAGELAGRK
jgi:hypothetical protein